MTTCGKDQDKSFCVVLDLPLDDLDFLLTLAHGSGKTPSELVCHIVGDWIRTMRPAPQEGA